MVNCESKRRWTASGRPRESPGGASRRPPGYDFALIFGSILHIKTKGRCTKNVEKNWKKKWKKMRGASLWGLPRHFFCFFQCFSFIFDYFPSFFLYFSFIVPISFRIFRIFWKFWPGPAPAYYKGFPVQLSIAFCWFLTGLKRPF